MRLTLSAAVSLMLAGAAPSTRPEPPQLLGVWYGTYQVGPAGQATQAEMWMEISYQLSENGYEIRGYDRWNVLDEPGERAHGSSSLGRQAEYFDTFDGSIAADGKSVTLTEDHREGRIEARVLGPNTLAARYAPDSGTTAGFAVRLERVDTQYQPGTVSTLGIDVSHHSGKVDWQRVRQHGYRFAYVKASEGVDNPDVMFETHWKTLGQLGMPRGAYHFYVTEDDPVEQATFFVSRLGDDRGTLPPAVDIELLGRGTSGDMSSALLRFLRTVEERLGVKPAVYTNTGFWDSYFRPEFSAYPLWMSEYGVALPKVPFGWKNWLFWQTAENRKVAGVENAADLCMVHPSLDLQDLQPGESAKRAR